MLPQPAVLIAYGSQKGQAQAIAEEVNESTAGITVFSTHRPIKTQLICLSNTNAMNLLRETYNYAIFIVSTTGDGEPPETMRKFWRQLKDKNLPNNYLSHLKFGLLGLGDSNYNTFCAMGKNLNNRLIELGATAFYSTGYADDGIGIELVVDDWIDNVWPAYKRSFEEANIKLHTDESTNITNSELNSILNTHNIIEISSCNELLNLQQEEDLNNVVVSKQPILTQECDDPLLDEDILLTSNSNTENGSTDNTDRVITHTPRLSPIHQLSTITRTNTTTTNNSSIISINDNVLDNITEELLKLNNNNTLLLTTPTYPPDYINVDISQTRLPCPETRNKPVYPGDQILQCDILTAKLLTDTTKYSDVNTVYELKLQLKDTFSYQPGAAIGILCPNNICDVEFLLNRLKLNELADCQLKLSVMENTTKKVAYIPAYIPENCTIKEVFLYYLDIRGIPKKSFLWCLSHFASNEQERARLVQLCSKEGSPEYIKLVRECNISILDVLYSFPSCQPPLRKMLELLQPLLPRYYSICNSQLSNSDVITIVYSLVELPNRPWTINKRVGLCTGWLSDLITPILQNISPLLLKSVYLAPRMVNPFHPPTDLSIPIIMVGPGTGIAPFIGFLEHRMLLKVKIENDIRLREQNPMKTHLLIEEALKYYNKLPVVMGDTYLYYGCRHEHGDYLYRSQLEEFVNNGTLTLLRVAFSRDNNNDNNNNNNNNNNDDDNNNNNKISNNNSGIRYVQDNMLLDGELLFKLIDKENAIFYLCGDAKHMAGDVRSAWIDICIKFGGMKHTEAEAYLTNLTKNKRYKQDIWA